ncbi:MAG: dienelactone hydrolase family protein [Microthrixaceae bacterium]
MTTTRYESVSAHDGGTFEAFCAVPDSGRGPGVLLFQEIFGINDNMRGLAEKLAGEGYTVLVPDMFWRLEPRFERGDESGLGDAFAMVQRFDAELGAADITATHAHLLDMTECTGTIGAVGFCLGGTLALACAARSRVDGKAPDAAVSYYGSGNNGLLDLLDEVSCPVLFHYGSNDPFIPEDQIVEVERAIEGRPTMRLERYDAGHAFSNWDAPSMYQAEAAELAWSRTLDFFATHLR